ncbi:MAG: thioredoxin domain-containing protein, partial [Myxococcota bacterium]
MMMKKTTLRWCTTLVVALSLTQVAASCGQEKSSGDDVSAEAEGAKADGTKGGDEGSVAEGGTEKKDAAKKPESPYPELNFEMFEAKEAERFIKLAESELSPCEGAKESLHETLQKTPEEGRCGLAMRAAEFLFRSIKVEKLNDTDTLNALAEYTKALTTKHTFALKDRAVKGDPKAKVVLVEFADFLCSHCRQAVPVMEKITDKYGDQIAFYYK